MTDETERMEHIIGDLLDLARVEGGGGELEARSRAGGRRSSSACSIGTIPHWRANASRSSVRLHLMSRRVIGDANRLEQAIQNLAANAVRHTPEGGRIRLTADRVAGGVRLGCGRFSGPGIPPEHLPRIFDRFYKVDVSRTGTDVPSGSGLGLSIVQAIVKRHGGTIDAANTAAGGARFDMVLPDDTAQPQ